MPRGIILCRIGSSWDNAIGAVRELQEKCSLVGSCGCVIESWGPCMGVADLAVVVFGLSVESIRLAASRLRDAVDSKGGGKNFTMTSTMIASCSTEIARTTGTVCDLASDRAKALETISPEAARNSQVIKQYLQEALQASKHMALASEGESPILPVDSELKNLLSQLAGTFARL